MLHTRLRHDDDEPPPPLFLPTQYAALQLRKGPANIELGWFIAFRATYAILVASVLQVRHPKSITTPATN
jgi:hypothetical protein